MRRSRARRPLSSGEARTGVFRPQSRNTIRGGHESPATMKRREPVGSSPFETAGQTDRAAVLSKHVVFI